MKTSPEEWHDSPGCIASAIKVISIKTWGDFPKRDVALTEDYFLTLGKELGRYAVYLVGGGDASQQFFWRLLDHRLPVSLMSGLRGFPACLLPL